MQVEVHDALSSSSEQGGTLSSQSLKRSYLRGTFVKVTKLSHIKCRFFTLKRKLQRRVGTRAKPHFLSFLSVGKGTRVNDLYHSQFPSWSSNLSEL